MATTHKKVIEGSQFEGMRYANLVYENEILIIQQTQFNNKTLINNLIDSYNRLVREYKIEKEMCRQKIISKLNSNTKDFMPVSQQIENEEVSLKDNKDIKTSMETKMKHKKERNWKEVKYKTIMKTNLKDDRNYRSKRNKED